MLRRFESWPDWKIALALTAALRILYSLFAAVLSFVLHPDPMLIGSNALTENLPPAGTWHYALVGVWERFDTLWYLHIAQHGYDLPSAVIFYPLYPITIRILSSVLPATVAALTISTFAAWLYFVGMMRLSSSVPENPARWRTLLLISVWPTSFILMAGYAESLNLALIVWAVALARQERWQTATLCGILAGMCRPSGVLASIPLIVRALRSRRPGSLITLLSPAGLLAYWGFLHFSGRLSVMEAYRIYQGSKLAPPWASLNEVLHLIFVGHDWLLAIKLGLVGLVVVFSLRPQLRIEDRVFALAVVLQILLYTGRPLLGSARYLLPAYPAFIMLGAFAARQWNRAQFLFYFLAFGFLNLIWFRAFLEWSLVF